jgi:ABC-type dipeptide/oligopeptide/nickel transport system permease subunit
MKKRKTNIFWSTFFERGTVKVCFVILCVFVLAAIFAPLIAPYDPYAVALKDMNMAPCLKHPFGTDNLGRDVLSRMLFGARASLSISISSVLLGGVIGMIAGMIAGYVGGAVDTVFCRCSDALMSIPQIVLVIAISTALGQSMFNIMISIGVSSIPPNFRMMRGTVLSAKERDYITATRVIGAPNLRIMFMHLFPNCISPLIISAAMSLGGAIMAEASLSFLGIGIQPPNPAWGSMVSDGMSSLAIRPWLSLIPGFAIMLVVLSFNIIGDALRDALDPRIRGAS